MIICPLMSNPDVAREFNEIKDATSSRAAYAIWSFNNGNGIDKAPNGEPSILFDALLSKFKNRSRAIKEKAKYYTKSFFETFGDWINKPEEVSIRLDENGEPLERFLNTETNDKYLKEINSITQDIENYAVRKTIENLRNDSNIDITESVHNAKKEWIELRLKLILGETLQRLADAYGLKLVIGEDGRITFVSDKKDGKTDLIIQFLDYISNDEQGYYDFNSKSSAAHHAIAISLTHGDPSTFDHELAHHYIRMFWNSQLIQNALQAVSEEGMTDEEREEALVEIITARTTDSQFMSCIESQSFILKFWASFANILYNIGIKNNAIRNLIFANITRAFFINEELRALSAEKRLFSMHDGRMFKRGILSKIKDVKYDLNRKDRYRERLKKSRENKRTNESLISYDTYSQDPTHRAIQSIAQGTVSRNKEFRKSNVTNPQMLVQMNILENAVRKFLQDIQEYRKRFLDKNNLSNKKRLSVKDRKDLVRNPDEINANVELIRSFLETALIEMSDIVLKLKNSAESNYTLSVLKEVINPATGETSIEYLDDSHKFDDDVTVEEISFDDLVHMHQNVIGFYRKAIEELHSALTTQEFEDIYGKDIRDEFLALISPTTGPSTYNALLNPILNDIELYYNHAIKIRTRQFANGYLRNAMKDLSDDLVERAIYSVNTWLDNQNVWGDVGALDSWLKLPSHSSSNLVRMLLDIVDNINIKTNREADERAKYLEQSREKAMKASLAFLAKESFKIYGSLSPFNFDKIFIEKDERGLPTGNFISRINKGLYHKNRQKFINDILYGKGGYEDQIRLRSGDEEFELDIDAKGDPMFPESFEDLEKDFRHKLNHWTAKHAVRPFTEKYYDTKIDMLSKVTERAEEAIGDDINAILKACTINSKIHTELLSPSKMKKLKLLYHEKLQLASPYDEYGREKPIGSLARLIADELLAWHKWVAGNVVYKKDVEAFEEAKNNAKDKNAFEKANTYPTINPEIWKHILTLYPLMTTEEIERLKQARNSLKSIIKSRGLKLPAIDQVWDYENKKIRDGYEDFWVNLKKLDDEISTMLYKIRKKDKDPDKKKAYDALMTRRPARRLVGSLLKSWIEIIETQIEERIMAENPGDPFIKLKIEEEKRKFYAETKDASGDVVKYEPLSIFTYNVPPTADVKINGNTIPAVINEPIQAYAVIDKENSNPLYVDTRFDFESQEFVQPISDETKNSDDLVSYTNEDYIKYIENGPKELKDYLKDLLDTMKMVYDIIPFTGVYDGRLVQKGGTSGQVYLTMPWNPLRPLIYWGARKFVINESDSDINIDYLLRPDGTRSMNIPVRYIRRLDNQEKINTDVLGSVIEFYQMALNYKYKSEELPKFQTVLNTVENSNTGRTGQINAIKGIINRQFYDRMKVLEFGEDNKISYKKGYKKFLLKVLPVLRSISTVGLLAMNWISAIVAWLDPATQVLTEAIIGKQYNMGDYMQSIGHMLLSLPGAILSVGSNTKQTYLFFNKTTGGMDYFGLGKTTSERYAHMDRNRVSKFLLEDIVMRPFSLGEYTVNALIFELVINRYKPFKDLKTGKIRFMTKQEYLLHAYDNGVPINTARRNWYKQFKTLRSAYTIKDGYFVRKSNDLGNALTDEFETMISKEMRSKSTMANLIVPNTERPGIQTNIMVAFVTVMRTFMLVAISERAKSLHDFLIDSDSPIDDTKISYTQNKLKEEYWEDKGGFNFQMRTIDDGIWAGLWRYIRHTRYWKYTLWRIAHPFKSTVDDDVKNKKQELRISQTDLYAMDRIATEVGLFLLIATASILFHNKMVDDGNDDKWWYQVIDHILMRWAVVRMTFFSPDTALDLITSVSASVTDIENKLTIILLLEDLYIGLSEHGTDINKWDKVEGLSAYKGDPKAMRSLFKTLSGLGLHSMYSSSSVEGIKAKTKWYKRMVKWNSFLKKPEKQKKIKPSTKKQDSKPSWAGSNGGKKTWY